LPGSNLLQVGLDLGLFSQALTSEHQFTQVNRGSGGPGDVVRQGQ
jgi:hypothetical protein